MLSRPILKLLRYFIFISLACSLIHLYLTKKSYLFNSRQVQKLGETNKGMHPNQSLKSIYSELSRKYPAHVVKEQVWVPFHAGGMNLKIMLLYASLTEYIGLIGSPMITTGHSGFHWMNQTCTLLTGTVEFSRDNQFLSKQDFKPGDTIKLKVFESASLRMTDDTWLICYGRGFVPLSTPYATLNAFASFDLPSVFRLAYSYLTGVANEARMCAFDAWNMVSRKFGLA